MRKYYLFLGKAMDEFMKKSCKHYKMSFSNHRYINSSFSFLCNKMQITLFFFIDQLTG